jgi:hypothetical protein
VSFRGPCTQNTKGKQCSRRSGVVVDPGAGLMHVGMRGMYCQMYWYAFLAIPPTIFASIDQFVTDLHINQRSRLMALFNGLAVTRDCL